MCVLVVEDELLIRMDLAITLEDEGHEVLCARHGPEALEFAASHPKPLTAVMTDFHMPGGMTGADIVSHLREQNPTIPMFIITAHTSAVTAEFVELHSVVMVGKPYDVFRLVKRLASAISDQRGK